MLDKQHLEHALRLAARGLGRTAPNPSVGCVIVSAKGHIVGRGWTGPGGRPHAEIRALEQASSGARGGTAYVTLEPCAHFGKTPPCATALICAGLKRVVAAVEDPDPRVRGKGLALLRAAGVQAEVGRELEAAEFLNAGFFLRIGRRRPLVTLKIVQSEDHKTISAPGESRWISSTKSRRLAHLLRATHDCILVGINTVLLDDPELTCRLPGLESRSPVRVILDSNLLLPLGSRVVRSTTNTPTSVFTTRADDESLRASGVDVIRVAADNVGRPALGHVLAILADRGCTRLLVEGGATIWSAFLAAGLVDRVELFTGSRKLGDQAGGSVQEFTRLRESGDLISCGHRAVGPDTLESFVFRA